MSALKNDQEVTYGSEKLLMSDWTGDYLKNSFNYPFSDNFGEKTILVSGPGHSLRHKDSLWVPNRIASAMERKNLGRKVYLLERCKIVNQSSKSKPHDRPKPSEHFESLQLTHNKNFSSVFDKYGSDIKVVLVDDIVTRGSTFLGCSWKIRESFPFANIFAFAVMRTVSMSSIFKNVIAPCRGTITYRKDTNDTLRKEEFCQ
jgi:hypothetical protein